jgi:Uma2 family endonuclease
MSSAAHSSISFTYDEYCLLPNDGKRYEIIDGELYVSPAPSPFHQTVSRRLQYVLMTQLEQSGIALVFNAPCDLLFEHKTVVQPI